jgi:hypothetical protein
MAVEYGYAFQRITKSRHEHLGDAQFNRPPLPAQRHGFSPPFTIWKQQTKSEELSHSGNSDLPAPQSPPPSMLNENVFARGL